MHFFSDTDIIIGLGSRLHVTIPVFKARKKSVWVPVVDWRIPYKERKVRSYFASGNGEQHAIVIPELDLVIGF